MISKKISETEAVAIFINLFCAKLFLITPKDFVDLTGSGAIIFVVILFALAFIFFSLYIRKNAFRIAESKTFLIIISSILIVYGAITLSQLVYYAKVIWFIKSPLPFLTIPFAVCMVLAALHKFCTIGKINGFFVPIIYISVILITLTSYKAFDFTSLTPVFGKGGMNMIKSTGLLLSSVFEFILLLFLPQITDGSHKKTGFLALLFSSVIFVFVIGCYLLAGGDAKDLPLLYVIRSGFLGKSDSMFLILYAVSGFLYLGSILTFASLAFCKAFKINDQKNITLPLSLIIISLSGITFFSPEGKLFLKIFSSVLWAFPFLIPVIFIIFKRERK